MSVRIFLSIVVLLSTVMTFGPTTAAAYRYPGFHSVRAVDLPNAPTKGRAIGRKCGTSRWGNWRWYAFARSTNGAFPGTIIYRWVEPLYPDGRHRHLDYAPIGGSAIGSLPPAERQRINAQVIGQLEQTTVAVVSGGSQLEFNVGGIARRSAFRPLRGC